MDGDPRKNLGLFQKQGKNMTLIMKHGLLHKIRLLLAVS